ncbi:hypothetical protein SESBI_05347 [Sesbania bispinosa]|nr:hypothetical protein SESBI_05347 [Sesbania bispinosa]
MACENKNTQKKRKPFLFSQTEIEAARQLIQLSNSIGDSSLDEDHHSSNNSSSVQGKPQLSKGDSSAEVSLSLSPTDSVEDVLAEIEEDERLRRKIKRYRYIEDLYNVTKPI